MARRLLALTLALVPLTACEQSAPPERRYAAADPSEREAIEGFVRVYRAQLDAPNPKRAFNAVLCEDERISRLFGDNRADSINRIAHDLAFRDADPSKLARVDAELRGGLYGADDDVCVGLAREGMLGDTIWPPLRRAQGSTSN